MSNWSHVSKICLCTQLMNERNRGVFVCPSVWCHWCHFNVRCCGLMLQMVADSAGASAPTGCRPWVKRSWCFCWSVCQKKKLSQETSSHSISTFTKKPKKVDSTYTPFLCVSLHWFVLNRGKTVIFCFRQVFGGAGQCDVHQHFPRQQGPRRDALPPSHVSASWGPHSPQSTFLVWPAHPETGGALGQSIPNKASPTAWIGIQWWVASCTSLWSLCLLCSHCFFLANTQIGVGIWLLLLSLSLLILIWNFP